MINKIITWDFDGTLSDNHDGSLNIYKETAQENLKLTISLGYDVHIVTRRFDEENNHKGLKNEHLPVINMAKKLGVDYSKIHFTNRSWKYETVQRLGSSLHIDDDEVDILWIQRHAPETSTILVGSENWQEKLLKYIEQDIKDNQKINLLDKVKNFLKKIQPF